MFLQCLKCYVAPEGAAQRLMNSPQIMSLRFSKDYEFGTEGYLELESSGFVRPDLSCRLH